MGKVQIKTEIIQAKVAARKLAPQLVSLCEWEDGTGINFAETLLTEMAKLLPRRQQPAAQPKQQLTYAHLANLPMPFGTHQGKNLADIPTDYLDWRCRNHEDFYKILKQFLNHPERPRD